MKTLIRKILKEETSNKFIDKVASYVKLPYFKNMEGLGVSEDEIELVFSRIFNQPVSIDDDSVYNTNGNEVYIETDNGFWEKYEYDTNGNMIYFENSDGYWIKYEYDNNGNRIYYEGSDGDWDKTEYDSNGNKIYYEDSNGYWIKREYDDQGNEIYYESSTGYIEDKR